MSPEAHRTPVYEQIADEIRDRIHSGDLAEGDPVPSISEIKAAWKVHTMTAARALEMLRNAGLVAGRTGLPTVVAPQRTVAAEAQVATELGVPVGTMVRVTSTDLGALFIRP